MPNILTITVENPDEILNAGAYGAGALIRLQTSATEAGAYADVSGTGSTPTQTVLTGVRSYTGYDPAGTSTSWYRTRYENVGATRLSDWSPVFQAGDETGALICSLYDVKQRLGIEDTNTDGDETLLDIIRGVTDDFEDYTHRWLAPRPTSSTSTMTLLFDVPFEGPYYRTELLLTNGFRRLGIRSVTAVGVATTSQPQTAGSYTSATIADILIRPQPMESEPGWRIAFTNVITGSVGCFYPGYNTVQVTGSFGPASVRPRVQEAGIEAVTRRWIGKETASPVIGLGPEGNVQMLRSLSPDSRAILDRLKVPLAA